MNQEKLRIGILLDDLDVDAWAYKMIEILHGSAYASLDFIIVNQIKPVNNRTLKEKFKHNFHRIGSVIVAKLLDFVHFRVLERATILPDALALVNIRNLLPDVEVLEVIPHQKIMSDYFSAEDIDKIQQQNLDILIRFGFRILRGEILNSARYGIWSYHHGDNRVNRGGPAGFWESMQQWSETGAILQILNEDLDNGLVLARSWSCTNRFNVGDNVNNLFWKTLSIMPRKIEELHRVGEKDFFEKVERNNSHPGFYSNRLFKRPSNYEYAKLLLHRCQQKLKITQERMRYMEQWQLRFCFGKGVASSMWRYKPIIPPKDRFWADPHIVFKDEEYHVFIEELPYSTGKGHISVMQIKTDGTWTEPVKVINKPYHLSYPFVFEYQDELYMIPESMANETVELYKCQEFPHQWEFCMNLMEGVKAADATVLYRDGKWWLFANMVEVEGAPISDELFLYSSDELLSTDWKRHPASPVVSDVKSARPAGRIFEQNGKLYRPSQNCSHRYGYGFNLCEIKILNDDDYKEEIVTSVKPDWEPDVLATHTFSHEGKLSMIDVKVRRSKRG